MKREEIKALIPDITDDQLKSVLDINSADIGKAKGDYDTVKTERDTVKTKLTEYETKLSELTEKANSADSIKAELETFKQQVATEKQQAEAQAAEAQRKANIQARFEAVSTDKKWKWVNEKTKAGYLTDFEAALADKANEGKSDADILHNMTKDTPNIFEGVTVTTLPGGNPQDPPIVTNSLRGALAEKYNR